MGTRYRKSINLGGGSKLNISKSGIGISSGIKGARISTNTNGRTRKTVSIPNTGISYVKETKVSAKKKVSSQYDDSLFEDYEEDDCEEETELPEMTSVIYDCDTLQNLSNYELSHYSRCYSNFAIHKYMTEGETEEYSVVREQLQRIKAEREKREANRKNEYRQKYWYFLFFLLSVLFSIMSYNLDGLDSLGCILMALAFFVSGIFSLVKNKKKKNR